MILLIDKLIKEGYKKDKAITLIKGGYVKINGREELFPNQKINETDEITVKKSKEWVSRGAYKLLAAIKEFNIDFNNKIVLDVGSSTGGFTEVALENGAKKVFALDVGTNQLDFSLRRRNDVISMEKTNMKEINPQMFDELFNIVVADVSFISLKHLFKALSVFEHDFIIMALIKPQFEAHSSEVEKGGFVSEEKHFDIIEKVKSYAQENNIDFLKIDKSPIKGGVSKNIEYITLFRSKYE